MPVWQLITGLDAVATIRITSRVIARGNGQLCLPVRRLTGPESVPEIIGLIP